MAAMGVTTDSGAQLVKAPEPLSPSIAAAVHGLSKRFGPVHAVRDVSFEVVQGEVHALCGENGAGKSTVFKILAGEIMPDQGSMTVLGEDYQPHGVAAAVTSGVSIVHQEFNLIPSLSVAENIFIANMDLFSRYGRIRWTELHEAARDALSQVSLDLDPRTNISTIPQSDRKLVEFARALASSPQLILLDEVTAALHREHCDTLFRLIRESAQQGCAVIYVSHRLDEIFRICDRVSVMKDGAMVATRPVADLDEERLSSLMIGRDIDQTTAQLHVDPTPAEPYLAVRDLLVTGVLNNISFQVARGELLSIAGLSDSGADELLEIVFGLRRPDHGDMTLDGRSYHPHSVGDAMSRGVAMVPKERTQEGLIENFDVRANIAMASLASLGRSGFLATGLETRLAERGIELFDVKCRGPETVVTNLSGGNKQKVMLAKWMLTDPTLLLLNNPTRGVDVGVKFEIYKLIDRLRRELHLTIILVSEDMAETIRLSDAVVTLRRGRITGAFRGPGEITESKLINGML